MANNIHGQNDGMFVKTLNRGCFEGKGCLVWLFFIGLIGVIGMLFERC